MALIEVKVPQLSESVAEATLLQWHKKPGDSVARDENMIDIETDKASRVAGAVGWSDCASRQTRWRDSCRR